MASSGAGETFSNIFWGFLLWLMWIIKPQYIFCILAWKTESFFLILIGAVYRCLAGLFSGAHFDRRPFRLPVCRVARSRGYLFVVYLFYCSFLNCKWVEKCVASGIGHRVVFLPSAFWFPKFCFWRTCIFLYYLKQILFFFFELCSPQRASFSNYCGPVFFCSYFYFLWDFYEFLTWLLLRANFVEVLMGLKI